jgi:hypothetical protein
MHPIKFTSDCGLDEWLIAEHITHVHRSSSTLTAVYLTHGKYVHVRESPEEIARLIKEAVTPPARPKASLLSRLTFGVFA